jgi:hypothetical protein
MTHTEAIEEARRLNAHDELWAKPVRILPLDEDPIRLLDNGWDVEVKIIGDDDDTL